MIPLPPGSSRTDTRFPYTTLFLSPGSPSRRLQEGERGEPCRVCVIVDGYSRGLLLQADGSIRGVGHALGTKLLGRTVSDAEHGRGCGEGQARGTVNHHPQRPIQEPHTPSHSPPNHQRTPENTPNKTAQDTPDRPPHPP